MNLYSKCNIVHILFVCVCVCGKECVVAIYMFGSYIHLARGVAAGALNSLAALSVYVCLLGVFPPPYSILNVINIFIHVQYSTYTSYMSTYIIGINLGAHGIYINLLINRIMHISLQATK